MKLVYVTTVATTQYRFLNGQNRYMREHGFELHSIATPDDTWQALQDRDQVILHPLTIPRSVSPLRDLWALWRLYRKLRELRPDLLHLSTPKAALLGAIAGWWAGVPARIYLARSSPTEPARGLRRTMWRWLERLIVRLSHRTIAVSHSLKTFLETEHIVRSGECIVVGQGMSNGIDVRRFNPATVNPVDLSALFPQLSLSSRPTVIGFVGSLALDKGIGEIATAWEILKEEYPEAVLLLCGAWEGDSGRLGKIRETFSADPRVAQVCGLSDVERYYANMDMGLLPSHGTEGFPNAPMEAAAMCVPMIVSDAIGCVDTVADGETGQIVPVRDAEALTAAMRAYLHSPEIRREHGVKARERVIEHFQREHIWSGLYAVYHELLGERLPAEQVKLLRQPMVFGLTDEPELKAIPPVPNGM